MTKHPNRLWIVALLLGWVFDFLFWKKGMGVNFPIFAALCLLGGLLLLLPEGIRPARGSLWLLLPFVFFAGMTAVRQEPLTTLLSYGLTLLALSLFALTYLGGRWYQYGIVDYFARYLGLAGSMITRPLSFNQEARKERAEHEESRGPSRVWPVVRGLLIALPIVAVFAALLASADIIFGQQLNRLMQLLRLEKLPEYIFRSVYILVGAYLIAGVLLHAAFRSRDEKLVGEGSSLVPRYLGFTESSIVLGSVGVLFLAFVIVQFQYFFGGHANIRIDGYTYSEYARRGFGELVAVAFFTLLLLLSLSGLTRREWEIQQKVFSGLGAGLVALVLVMLVSAYQRLTLYESAYGFSRLRTYTHVVLYWIALLLVGAILLEVLRQERRFAFAALAVALGFAASLSLLNVDAFIVKQNIAREMGGAPQVESTAGRASLDLQYFLNLSDDAVPPMVEAFRSASLPAGVRNRVGAALACIRYRRSQDDRTLPWQSFHWARYRADRALASITEPLDAYTIRHNDRSVEAVDSQGAKFSCSGYYAD